jgi:hypothetical protein
MVVMHQDNAQSKYQSSALPASFLCNYMMQNEPRFSGTQSALT